MNRLGRIRAAAVAGVAVIAVLAGMAPAAASGAGAATAAGAVGVGGDKIRPELRQQLSQQTVGPDQGFWVRFGKRADLSAASAIDDWKARGTAVAGALQRAADSAQRNVRKQLDAKGAQYETFWATNAIRVSHGTLQLAEQLATASEVEGLYTTTTYEPPQLDKGAAAKQAAAVEWGIANINADDVWSQYGDRGAGITVANIDTGVQYDHPALVNQYRGNNGDGTFDHNYNWFDAAGTCGSTPCDNNGHGTHTMGTMAGDDGAGHQIGVAPAVKWIAANGCCPTDAALIESGQWMLQPRDLNGQNPDAGRRPQIINNSWGSEVAGNDPFMEDITLAWAASGIFGVWSNGNLGFSCDTSSSPGSRTANYSAGAYDINNTIAGFSSRGAGQDGEIKPNLSAPGVDVRSSIPGNGYTTASGTSMAAPHVAGAIALMWSAAPGLVGDIAATRRLLDGSSVNSPDGQCGGTDADNNVYGEGRLDALALVDAAPVGDTGTLGITVKDAKTGKPVPSAAIKISGPVNRERVAGQDGTYSLPLPVGQYTVQASWFGYYEQTATVTVTAGRTTTSALLLTPMPRVDVTGTVSDSSGQGWPLYAKITVENVPGGTFYTNPANGRYSFQLPADAKYKYAVEAKYPGYEKTTAEVALGGRGVKRDVQLTVDTKACMAPGYGLDGVKADFDNGLPEGWSSIGNLDPAVAWRFDDPLRFKNRTGGKGGFAIAQSPGSGVEIDTSLVSPILDLSAKKAPVISFRQDLITIREDADVDLSIDGGASWETVLHQTDDVRATQTVLPIPQAAGQSDVRVRFHYSKATFAYWYWQLDDVFVGDLHCGPVAGGLVVGHVGDLNTGGVLNGATVRSGDRPTETVKSAATPDDGNLADGFYWMFSSLTGKHPFGATAVSYQNTTERVKVESGEVTRLDFRLPAGQLSVRPAEVSVNVEQGGTATASFTVTNKGSAPAKVGFTEREAGALVAAGNGAEVVHVAGDYSPLGFIKDSTAPAGPGSGDGLPPATPWVGLPDYPNPIMDNAVGELGGQVYSVGGVDGDVISAKSNVYDPAKGTWSPIADLPQGRQNAAGAVIGDLFYLNGGWDPTVRASKNTFAYDRRTNSWSQLADAPVAMAASGRAVLDGQLYLVGGCTNACDSMDVRRYDPASNTWSVLANYPEPGGHHACAALDGQLYCAGGVARGGIASQSTYGYDPGANTWTKKANLPIDLWGMGYTGSYGQLLVSGGITSGAITNEGFSYDPATDAWSELPASKHVLYRGGSACGLHRIGGSIKSGFFPVDAAELLPTYGDCVPADVSWLSIGNSAATLAPGRSITVTLRLDAAQLKPGTYPAGVWIKEDTPYLATPVDVILQVKPKT